MTKVLIADDSPLVVKMVKATLLSPNFTLFEVDENHVVTASDGLEAFNQIALHKDIQYLISDINMPHLNGDELIELLTDTEKLGEIKVIFITTTEKVLTKHDNPAILGTITKPLNPPKIIEKFSELIAKYNAIENQESSNSDINPVIFIDIAKKYLSKIGVPASSFDQEMFSNILSVYWEETLKLSDREYVEILLAVIAEYLMDKNINRNVDKKRVEYIFYDCLYSKSEENEIKELYKFFQPQSFEINEDEVIQYLTNHSVIEPNVEIRQVIKNQFETMLVSFKGETLSLDKDVKRLEYLLLKNYVLEFVSLIECIDFTLISNEIKENIAKYKLFAFYFEEMDAMMNKTSNEEYFKKMFLPFQDDYYKVHQLFQKHIEDTEVNEQIKMGKVQEMLERFGQRYKMEFSKFIKEFLKQYHKKAYMIIGYYINQIFESISEKAKKSDDIKDFYMKNTLPGEIGPRAFLNYYTRTNQLSNSLKNEMDRVGKYLLERSKKSIVVASHDVNDISTFKRSGEKVNLVWDVTGYNKIEPLDGLLNAKAPNILIIEHGFKIDNENFLISQLMERYPKLKNKTSVVVIFEKISVNDMQKNIIDKDFDYLKKPLDVNKVAKKLAFI